MKSRILKTIAAAGLALTLTVTVMPFASAPAMAAQQYSPILQQAATQGDKVLGLAEDTAAYYNFGTAYPGTQTIYYRINPLRTGYITVTGMYGYVTLLNGSKNPVSSRSYINYESTASYLKYINYGVTKGQTYYLKVEYTGYTKSAATNNQYYGYAYFKSTTMSGKFGKSKKRASTLSRSKKRYGYIAAGSSTSKWYKVKSKKKKTVIYFTGTTDEVTDSIKATVYYRSGGHTYKGTMSTYRGDTYLHTYTITSTSKHNTYYIKVTRSNSKTSGAYYLKWK